MPLIYSLRIVDACTEQTCRYVRQKTNFVTSGGRCQDHRQQEILSVNGYMWTQSAAILPYDKSYSSCVHHLKRKEKLWGFKTSNEVHQSYSGNHRWWAENITFSDYHYTGNPTHTALLNQSTPKHQNHSGDYRYSTALFNIRHNTVGFGFVQSFYLSHEEALLLLKMKRRPLYLKIQSVPRCKHFSSRL